MAVDAPGFDADGDAMRFRVGAVADRVFDQRLQNQLRDERRRASGSTAIWISRSPSKRARMMESHASSSSSSPESRYLLMVCAAQREAQELAEARDHRVRRGHVLVHHRRNSIQRIKKEMRLELQLEIARPGRVGSQFGLGVEAIDEPDQSDGDGVYDATSMEPSIQ